VLFRNRNKVILHLKSAQASRQTQEAEMDSDERFKELIRLIPPLELLRIAPMDEVERLSSLSPDSIERNHPDKIRKLSKRRRGMRVIDALMLRDESETT
jgi:hypothetical protein